MNETAVRIDDEVMKVETGSGRYYYVYGMQFEKGKSYTHEDYMKLPEGLRVELIDGVFYELYPEDPITGMAAPKRAHQELAGELFYRIRRYIEENGGSCRVYPAPFAVRVKTDNKNTVEPDVSVICDPSKLTDEGCMGAPDWIIEIVSPSNPGNDYIRKLNLYREAGVREYWIVDPDKNKVSVYEFEKGAPAPKEFTFKDKVKASIYDDLVIDFSAIDLE